MKKIILLMFRVLGLINFKKLALVPIILMCIPLVSAFEDPITGNSCSTDLDDYQYFKANEVVGIGNSFLDIEDLPSSGQAYVLYFNNLTTDGQYGNVRMSNEAESEYSFGWFGTEVGDLSWDYRDGGALQPSTMIHNSGVNYNVTIVADRYADTGNYTISNDTASVSYNDKGVNTDQEFGKVHLQATAVMNVGSIYVWNCTGTQCECPLPPAPPPEIDSLNLTTPNPLNNTQFGVGTTDIAFNVSLNTTTAANCSLYINNTVNETINDNSAGENVLVNVTVDFTDSIGNYNYYFNCSNDANTTVSVTQDFYTDTVNPTITYNTPSGETVTTSITLDIDLFDTNSLFLYDINLTLAGVSRWNDSNNNLFGNNTYTITDTLDLTDNGTGTYYINTKVCDGHTDNEIEYMEIEKYAQLLTFNGLQIYAEAGTGTDYIYLDDRYGFTFYTLPTEELELVLDPKCVYLPTSKHKGHFVCDNTYWVDLEGDFTEWEYRGNNRIKVKSEENPLTEWTFNSIGELNCVKSSQSFSIDVTAPTVTNVGPRNDTIQKRRNVPLTFTVDEESNCTIFVNNLSNGTTTNSNGETTFTTQNLAEYENYTWNVNCSDGFSNSAVSTEWFFTVEMFHFGLERFDTCDYDSTTGKSIFFIGFVFVIVLIWLVGLWSKIPVLNIFIFFFLAYFSWVVAPCVQFINLLFVVMAFVSLGTGLINLSNIGKNFGR